MIRKRRNIKLSTLIILFTVLLVILASVLAIVIVKNSKADEAEKIGSNQQEGEKPRFDSNNWDNAIVADVKQEIPIPRGFEYVSGDKDTGIIVANVEKEIAMMWIPYNEKANELDTSKYFAKVDNYEEPDSDIIKSMQKYGGFFVDLYTGIEYNELENVTKEEYNALIKYDDIDEGIESVHTHLLCKQELQQVEYYLKESQIKCLLGPTGATIEPYSNLYIDENSVETSSIEDNSIRLATAVNKDIQAENKKAMVYMLETKDYNVPIPVGYKYGIDEKGNVSIQDASNENLIYVWVPLKESEINSRKKAIKSMYENWKNEDGEKLDITEATELYKTFNLTEEELNDEFKKSIKKYGGFYISEAELSYDANNKFYNKARGMVNSSASGTKTGGDYFRKNAKYETLTYPEMLEISSSVAGKNQTVVSHLTYGVEYDAAVLWIQKTNKDYKDSKGNDITTVLMHNSTYVGKYRNSNYKMNETALESAKFFNGIWGLGGNLAEITQEKYKASKEKEGYIARGGSYATTGQVAPIASRKIVENCSSEAIGFRVCLYVVPNAKEIKQKNPTFEKNEEDYENEIPKEEETTNSGTTDPGTSNPGTTDPGTSNPGTTDPGTSDPGMSNPGTSNPGAKDPVTPNPGTSNPGAKDPVTPNPGTSNPGAKDPVTPNPGTTTPAPQPTLASGSNTIVVGQTSSVGVNLQKGWQFDGFASNGGTFVTSVEYKNNNIWYKGLKQGQETIGINFKYQDGKTITLWHTVTVNEQKQTNQGTTTPPTQEPTISRKSNIIDVGTSRTVTVNVPTGWKCTTYVGRGEALDNVKYSNGIISYTGKESGTGTIFLYFEHPSSGSKVTLEHEVIVVQGNLTKMPTLERNCAFIKVGQPGSTRVNVPTGWKFVGRGATAGFVTITGYNGGFLGDSITYKGAKAGMDTISLNYGGPNEALKELRLIVRVTE